VNRSTARLPRSCWSFATRVVAAGGDAEIVGAHGGVRAHARSLRLPSTETEPTPTAGPIGILDEIGRETLGLLGESRGLDFIGDVALSGRRGPRAGSINWTDVPRLVERAGADSVPIVLVINFLVGLVTAFRPRCS